MSLITDTFGVC